MLGVGRQADEPVPVRKEPASRAIARQQGCREFPPSSSLRTRATRTLGARRQRRFERCGTLARRLLIACMDAVNQQ
jgi:hypothetical protein